MADQAIPQIRPIVTRRESMARGLKRYFSGKACKHGHVDERFVINGCCCKCAELSCRTQRVEKPHKGRRRPSKRCKNGHVSERTASGFCIECARAWDRQNYRRNLDKFREKNKKLWLRADKKRVREQRKEWHKKNPEANKRYCKARYWDDPNKAREYNREWKRKHPEIIRIVNARRVHRKRANGGDFTSADIKRIRQLQDGRCAYCHRVLIGRGHIDHIVAVSKGGPNYPSNLQLCCKQCNSRKGARDPVEFAQSLGLLL